MLIDPAMTPLPDRPWRMDDHELIWIVDNIFQQRLPDMLTVGRPGHLALGLRRFIFKGNRISSIYPMHRDNLQF